MQKNIVDDEAWCKFDATGNVLVAENAKNSDRLIFSCDDELSATNICSTLTDIRGAINDISVSIDSTINDTSVYSLKEGSDMRIVLKLK